MFLIISDIIEIDNQSPSSPPAKKKKKVDNTESNEDLDPVYEGWHKKWEDKIPAADVEWLKSTENGMFTKIESKSKTKSKVYRYVMKEGKMWHRAPEPPGKVGSNMPSINSIFTHDLYAFRPLSEWLITVPCPRNDCPKKGDTTHFLTRAGYSPTVRWIATLDGWFIMITEMATCTACNDAASEDDTGSRTGLKIPCWSPYFMSKLKPCHRSMFPAVLTQKYVQYFFSLIDISI